MSIQNLSMQGVAVRAPVRFPLAVVAAAVSLVAFDASAQSSSEKKWSETVVTATRTPTLLDETLSDVTVITREQIEALAPGRSVVEVLQRLAGLQISSSNGGRGQSQGVFIRGAASNHTLLLIDGVRHGSSSQGAPSFANLPLELIERIEVVKGPASAMYGSEAVGGVIQIFTKLGSVKQPLTASGALTLGKHGHKSGNVAIHGAQAGWDYQVGLSRLTEKGFSSQNRQGFSFDPDKDGLGQSAANIAAGYAFNDDWRAEASWLRTDSRAHYDGSNALDYNELATEVANLKLHGKLLSTWTSNWIYSESKDKLADLGGSIYLAENQIKEFKWDNQIQTALGVALFGLERMEQSIDDGQATTWPKHRAINAASLGFTGSMAQHSWHVSARRDQNSQFGGFTSYGLNYGYELVEGVRAFAARGRSMRAPSVNELYQPSSWDPGWNGNPLLKPEFSNNYEFGVQFTQQAHRAKVLRYDNRVNNLIEAGTTQRINSSKETRLLGWTAEYGYTAGPWDVRASYDRLQASKADRTPLFYRPGSQIGLHLQHAQGPWTLGASALRVGSRPVSAVQTYASYATLDLSADYRINQSLVASLRLANATDRHYVVSEGYNHLGRAAYVSLKWSL